MAKKSSTASKTAEMMDASTPEKAKGSASVNNQRTCHAAAQFVEEFSALFPETSTTIEDYNGRNVGLSVVIEAPEMEDEATDLLNQLIFVLSVANDTRIADVVSSEDTRTFRVTMHNNPRTYDLTDPGFGLAEALMILVGDE